MVASAIGSSFGFEEGLGEDVAQPWGSGVADGAEGAAADVALATDDGADGAPAEVELLPDLALGAALS